MSENKTKKAAEVESAKVEEAYSARDYFNLHFLKFITKLVGLLNDYKKSGGADISEEGLKRFVQTCLYIAQHDFRISTIRIDDNTFALSDYKVNAAFMPFVMPRGVYASVGIEFRNLANVALFVSSTKPGRVDFMDPIEFQEFQELVLSKFKVKDMSWNGDMFTLTQPVALVDVFDKMGSVKTGVHCDDINAVHSLPMFLEIDIAEEYYYNTPHDVYFDALAHNIVAKLLTI